jgi:hypothetical protein
VARGVAVNDPALFAVELRRAGEILSASSSGDEAVTAAALAAVTVSLRRLGAAGAAPAPPVERPVVPIDSLAPDVPARAPPTAHPQSLTADAQSESADIAGSWSAYQRMVAGGVGPASLEELIKGSSPPSNGDLPVMDIGALVYRGARARQRAQELRDAAKRASGEDLRAIIDEVCDLVVLAIEPE